MKVALQQGTRGTHVGNGSTADWDKAMFALDANTNHLDQTIGGMCPSDHYVPSNRSILNWTTRQFDTGANDNRFTGKVAASM